MEDHDLLEFAKLKDEQISRIKFRDGLFYFTLAIIGGALTLALSDKYGQAPDVLLAVPFAAFIAGVAYISCDRRIDDIGMYIRDELAARIAKRRGVLQDEIFPWERKFRAAPLHGARYILQYISLLMLYVGSGSVALYIYSGYYTAVRRFVLARADYELARAFSDVAPVMAAAQNAQKAAYTAQTMDAVAWWFGVVLMVVMAALITRFMSVKVRLRQSGGRNIRNSVWSGRLGVALAVSAAMFTGIEYGARYTVAHFAVFGIGQIPHWATGWASSPQIVHVAAAGVALAVFVLVLTIRRSSLNNRSTG